MKEMTDKKETNKAREGVPMSEKALAEYEKVWIDIEESIAWCSKHPCKLDKKKK